MIKLEDIKDNWEAERCIKPEDVDWLIERVEGGKRMSSYYMFKEPYFAVVKADTPDDAIKTYERDVAEIEIPDYALKEDNELPFSYKWRMYKLRESRGKSIKEKYVLAMFHEHENGTVFESDEILQAIENNTTVLVEESLL